jgi:acylphosphatase
MVLKAPGRRLKVLFSGRVQGVGFRFTTCRIAASFRVTGFVRNLMDGSVEVIAEGTEQDLSDFLHEIKGSQLGRYITGEQVSWSTATGEYETFGVLY